MTHLEDEHVHSSPGQGGNLGYSAANELQGHEMQQPAVLINDMTPSVSPQTQHQLFKATEISCE